MSEPRPGCSYCFRCLRAINEVSMTLPALACRQCGALYHPDCWGQSRICFHCGDNGVEAIDVVVPDLAVPKRTRQALATRPVDVLYFIGTRQLSARQIRRTIILVLAAIVIFAIALPWIINVVGQVQTGLAATFATSVPRKPATTIPSPLPTPTVPPSTPTQEPTVVANGPARIQITDVNLRASANPESESLAVLMRGTTAEILGQPQRYEQTIWVKVHAGDRDGWINQRYLLLGSTAGIPRAQVAGTAPDTLRIRRSPNLHAEIVARLHDGSEVDLLSETQINDGINWRHIRIDSDEGWVDSQFLQPIP